MSTTRFSVGMVLAAAVWVVASVSSRGAEDAAKQWDALMRKANDALQKNDFAGAIGPLWKAEEVSERIGFTDRRYRDTLKALGPAAMQVNDYTKAQVAYSRLAWVEERRANTNASEVAAALGGQAEAEIFLKRFEDATKTLDRYEAIIQQQKFGNGSPAEAECLDLRGQLALNQGQSARAEDYFQKALDILKTLPPPGRAYIVSRHPSVALELNNLSLAYQGQGKLDKAEDALTRAIELDEWQYGKSSAVLAVPLYSLSEVYLKAGRVGEAQTTAQRALAILRAKAPASSMVAQTKNLLTQIRSRKR